MKYSIPIYPNDTDGASQLRFYSQKEKDDYVRKEGIYCKKERDDYITAVGTSNIEEAKIIFRKKRIQFAKEMGFYPKSPYGKVWVQTQLTHDLDGELLE